MSSRLPWPHYYEPLSVSDDNKRSFYKKESISPGWSVRGLKRRIDSSLYEWLLLPNGDVSKEEALFLAQKGTETSQPVNIIRDLYVPELFGVLESKPMLEDDLERVLVVQIEKFLSELGAVSRLSELSSV